MEERDPPGTCATFVGRVQRMKESCEKLQLRRGLQRSSIPFYRSSKGEATRAEETFIW